MTNNITKPLFITLFINLLLVVSGFGLIEGTGPASSFLDIDADGEIQGGSDELEETVPNSEGSLVQDPSGTTDNLIDSTGLVGRFVIFLFNIVTAPISLLIDTPNIVKVFVGVPLLLLNVMGYVSFFRSGA